MSERFRFRSPQTEAVHAKLSIGPYGVVRIFARDHQRISDPVHTVGGVLVLPATRRKTVTTSPRARQRLSTFKLGVICLVSVAATDPGIKAVREGKLLLFRNDRPEVILQYP
jgi:hypothetical protein